MISKMITAPNEDYYTVYLWTAIDLSMALTPSEEVKTLLDMFDSFILKLTSIGTNFLTSSSATK